jgi:hypothetical protein
MKQINEEKKSYWYLAGVVSYGVKNCGKYCHFKVVSFLRVT